MLTPAVFVSDPMQTPSHIRPGLRTDIVSAEHEL
jgi:hypothetical protein